MWIPLGLSCFAVFEEFLAIISLSTFSVLCSASMTLKFLFHFNIFIVLMFCQIFLFLCWGFLFFLFIFSMLVICHWSILPCLLWFDEVVLMFCHLCWNFLSFFIQFEIFLVLDMNDFQMKLDVINHVMLRYLSGPVLLTVSNTALAGKVRGTISLLPREVRVQIPLEGQLGESGSFGFLCVSTVTAWRRPHYCWEDSSWPLDVIPRRDVESHLLRRVEMKVKAPLVLSADITGWGRGGPAPRGDRSPSCLFGLFWCYHPARDVGPSALPHKGQVWVPWLLAFVDKGTVFLGV